MKGIPYRGQVAFAAFYFQPPSKLQYLLSMNYRLTFNLNNEHVKKAPKAVLNFQIKMIKNRYLNKHRAHITLQ